MFRSVRKRNVWRRNKRECKGERTSIRKKKNGAKCKGGEQIRRKNERVKRDCILTILGLCEVGV